VLVSEPLLLRLLVLLLLRLRELMLLAEDLLKLLSRRLPPPSVPFRASGSC
jgi:hypothetical protein